MNATLTVRIVNTSDYALPDGMTKQDAIDFLLGELVYMIGRDPLVEISDARIAGLAAMAALSANAWALGRASGVAPFFAVEDANWDPVRAVVTVQFAWVDDSWWKKP